MPFASKRDQRHSIFEYLKQAPSITHHVHNSWPGARIGVLTAGDDSQGMNAAIRAVVRTSMCVGATVIYIKHGFKGMVDGRDNFVEATWASASNTIGDGGTILKSFKCPEFMEHETRLKAAKNLVEHHITNIVVIGGDGSMKGIYTLHREWPSLLRELQERHMVSDGRLLESSNYLNVVGIVASIVNDVVGTDAAIGANSALHRIIGSTDAINTTASSSQLAFVVVVMGQTSGYLALCTALCCDATMVFMPEWPPGGDWKDELLDKVKTQLEIGSEGVIVVMAEGAIDRNCHPIRPEDVRNVLQDGMKLNAKITVLGHVQRGGSPSAFDRLIATRMGAEAVMTLRDMVNHTCLVLSIYGNEIRLLPLAECIEKTVELENNIKKGNFTEAVMARGRHFQELLSAYVLLHNLRSSSLSRLNHIPPDMARIGLVKIGKHTVGHCAVARAIVAYCQTKGVAVIGFEDGFEGLLKGKGSTLVWDDVKIWSFKTTTCLGSTKETAGAMGLGEIASVIHKMKFSGLILIGGFSAYESLFQMYEARHKYPGLCIPMCMVPVTVLNNVPGSETCIGSDSTLNEIVLYCDKMKRVATGHKYCVFVIEVIGQNCGYLATVSGLCVGADAAYIREENFDLDTLLRDVKHVKEKIQNTGILQGLFIRNERANKNYNTDFIHKLFSEEGKDVFQCRASVIGQVQMGGLPSAQDRIQSVLAGIRSAEWTVNMVETSPMQEGRPYNPSPEAKCVLCFGKRFIALKPINQLAGETNFQEHMPTYNWWMKLRPLLRILARRYDEDYNIETRSEVSLPTVTTEEDSSMFYKEGRRPQGQGGY